MWGEPKFLLCVMVTVKSIFQTGDVTMVYCLLLTPAKTQKQYFFVLTFGLVGFTGFRSLFFDRTFQNETLYKVPGSRKSETKKEKDHRHGSYLRTGKIQSRTDLDSLNDNLEAMR